MKKRKRKISKTKSAEKQKPKRKIFSFWRFILFLLVILVILIGYSLRRPSGTVTHDFRYGVAFSKIFSEQMGLDWRANYLAVLHDLKPEFLRLPVYWQDIEPQKGEFNFTDYDWMVNEAEKSGTKLVLVVGRKTPRWPECNVPEWSKQVPEDAQKTGVINQAERVVARYKDRKSLYAWQVENEPFLQFGDCKLLGGDFLDEEIEKVRALDGGKHPIMVTDSGELSLWLPAAKRADIFGTTMYRIVHSQRFGYIEYPFPPKFFWLKANLVHLFYPEKPIIVSELQTEPWGPSLIYDISVEEQMKTMTLDHFKANVEYAKAVGFGDIYLWGSEWWWWMKTVENRPEYWNEAREIFKH